MRGNMHVRFGGAGRGKQTSRNGDTAPRSDPYQHLALERTAELVGELLDEPVSTGWLCAPQAEAAGKLAGFITTVKEQISGSPAIHADETATHVGLVKHWVHTLSTNLRTLLVVHPKRGIERSATSACSATIRGRSSMTAGPPTTRSRRPPTPSAMFVSSDT